MDEMKELEDLKTQIKLLEQKSKYLEERLNRKSKKGLLSKPEPGSGQPYATCVANSNGVLKPDTWRANIEDPKYYEGFAIFQSEEQAQAYAQALNTFLALRHQPGTVPPSQDHLQWSISVEEDFKFIADKGWWNLESKLLSIFPCFEYQKDATAAIEAIGQDALAHMVKTFGHFQEDA